VGHGGTVPLLSHFPRQKNHERTPRPRRDPKKTLPLRITDVYLAKEDVHRTPTGYHVIAKHSLGRYPVRNHVIVTAKVGKWEEFPSDTSVGGVLGQKQVFFKVHVCTSLAEHFSCCTGSKFLESWRTTFFKLWLEVVSFFSYITSKLGKLSDIEY